MRRLQEENKVVRKVDRSAETPLMKQFYEIKRNYPDTILLFRVGDFYETFGEDAVFASSALNIVLTRRANGSNTVIELAGFPYHALENYLHKLVKAGRKVAICEQLEDPKLTKKLVKRGVTELITPGIALDDKLLEGGKNNFLCGICPDARGAKFGLAFVDVSTGEFLVAEGEIDYARKLLENFAPAEVVMPKTYRNDFFNLFGNHFYTTVFEDWVFKPGFARETITKHFKTNSLKGFGIEGMSLAQMAAASCLYYLAESRHENSDHISGISKLQEDNYVWMDNFTLRNLEIFEPAYTMGEIGEDGKKNSLFAVLNKTSTPMGMRLLRRFLALPLKDEKEIDRRLDHVQFLVENASQSDYLSESFKQIGDLERLLSKIASLRAQPRELLQLRHALETVESLVGHFQEFSSKTPFPIVEAWCKSLDSCPEQIEYIAKWIDIDAPAVAGKGNVIARGADAELDKYRKIAYSGKEYLSDLLQREIQNSGIANLKLGFNNVFGYYLEVSKSQKEKVPLEWVRKQTLTTGERYITDELKNYEEKVLAAQDKIVELEATLYEQVLQTCVKYIKRIQVTVQAIAFMDVMNSFARVSRENGYARPSLSDTYSLEIIKGRHPVIEKNLESGQKYVPNDIRFDYDSCRMMMITGPNMSGKSAVLRQTALIVLLAQAGCFVPAQSAHIGLVDKIFTRVGASDNIASGESTFMVEMNETANILNNITERSLVLLDEIGRGTSTYDGISIARAIAEYLHQTPKKNCKVLFATHYHELNQMAMVFPHIRNFHVKVKEVDNQVIFLRTLEEGGSAHSFGIHVAEMAGMPAYVVNRAKEILTSLEASRGNEKTDDFGGNVAGDCADGGATTDSQAVKKAKKPGLGEVQNIEKEKTKPYQLSFIQLDDPLLEKIRDEILDLDINSLTPVQALNKLDEIKRLLKGKNR